MWHVSTAGTGSRGRGPTLRVTLNAKLPWWYRWLRLSPFPRGVAGTSSSGMHTWLIWSGLVQLRIFSALVGNTCYFVYSWCWNFVEFLDRYPCTWNFPLIIDILRFLIWFAFLWSVPSCRDSVLKSTVSEVFEKACILKYLSLFHLVHFSNSGCPLTITNFALFLGNGYNWR